MTKRTTRRIDAEEPAATEQELAGDREHRNPAHEGQPQVGRRPEHIAEQAGDDQSGS